jgi:putative membrane-bound dehydrogenase-like protein
MKRILDLIGALLISCGAAFSQGHPAAEAAGKMTVAEGLEVGLFASEPMVRQPVAIEFDDRGRLWVIQYLQYPNPAGLKRVEVDRYSRTIYDRVPKPPPQGPRGADRITILEDTDGDGRADKVKDFLDGLNLASSLAFGRGGVFVVQVPYLLFYADKDGDDAPDGEPEVLLTGFGMNDAHSVANSLTWGPDGWLYGCQGSTVTAKIRGIEFQQGVWRYHPETKAFELFCEGGGNSWGLDFDDQGNLIYGTNHGGYVALHGVLGGYYWKSFGKHGALHNPFAYGYFQHIQHEGFKGGHVEVGGVIYRGESMPRLRGKYVAADLLGHAVYWHELSPRGSTFKSRHGGDVLRANDTWFAPTDVTVGPDGAIYVTDWHDKRTAHPDPDATWDRSNGRIFRIQAKGAKVSKPIDLAGLSDAQLIENLNGSNHWVVAHSRRLLGERGNRSNDEPLRQLALRSGDSKARLEALWALHSSGGVDAEFADRLLSHSALRNWAVRILSESGEVPEPVALKLISLASAESDVSFRSELASAAQRLPASIGLKIAERLARRNEDVDDPHVPLLVWWAVEKHCAGESLELTLELFGDEQAWSFRMNREVILERLIRRYAAEGSWETLRACATLLESARTPKHRRKLLAALEVGLAERSGVLAGAPESGIFQGKAGSAKGVRTTKPGSDKLGRFIDDLRERSPDDPLLIRIGGRLARTSALDRALELACDPKASAAVRVGMLKLLGELALAEHKPRLIGSLKQKSPDSVFAALVEALGAYDAADVAANLIGNYPEMNARSRAKVRATLFSRRAWTAALLTQFSEGNFAKDEVQLAELRRIHLHQDDGLNEQVRKLWGSVTGGTPEEKLAVMRRFRNDLNAGQGDAGRGYVVFQKACAVCHQLFGEGKELGPDLTHANRTDRDYLLASIVDPSAVIRKEHLSYNLETKDDQFLSGIIVEQNASSVTLLNAANERSVVSQSRIASLRESTVSMMPEGLLQALTPDELRDLFRYLQTGKPSAVR